MNDHELGTALRVFHVERTEIPDPPALHEGVFTMPFDDIPQRRSWLPHIDTGRFQSMFSATKFVVAGVIVALFGGFLLSGVLTQGPRDETAPAVGASASAPPEPTTATASPESSAEVAPDRTADTTIRADIIPGVDLEVEEVEPGVLRVVSDGVRTLTVPAYRRSGRDYSYRLSTTIAVSPDGAVFFLGPDGGYRLGDETVIRKNGRRAERRRGSGDVHIDADGTVWAQTERGLAMLVSGAWRYPRTGVDSFAVHPDGTVFILQEGALVGPASKDDWMAGRQ
jgi:hypothetical protein